MRADITPTAPALRRYGAVTQGTTAEDAVKNINEVVQMIVDELLEDGVALPAASDDDVEVFEGARVAGVNLSRADAHRLRSMIEEQARWRDQDLIRLNLTA